MLNAAIKYFLMLACLSLCLSCVLSNFFKTFSYDSRTLHLSILSLFNQATKSKVEGQNWRGDWVFRRERLALIDKELRQSRPDLILFQEALAKRDSEFDSDHSILKAGALLGYDWQELLSKEHTDQAEIETTALASVVPLVVRPINRLRQEVLHFGKIGTLSVFSVTLDKQELLLFAVDSLRDPDSLGEWFGFLSSQMEGLIKENRLCNRRIIVLGYMPNDVDNPEYQKWLDSFQLVDTSAGFCDQEEACFTFSMENEIYQATIRDSYQDRSHRILVHKSALVYEAKREFDQAEEGEPRFASLGQKKIWASRYFGWGASVRFARCE